MRFVWDGGCNGGLIVGKKMDTVAAGKPLHEKYVRRSKNSCFMVDR